MKDLVAGDLVEVLEDGIWEKRIFTDYNPKYEGSIYCVVKGEEENFLRGLLFKYKKYNKDEWKNLNDYKCSRIACNHPLHNCNICLENFEVQERLKLIKNQNDIDDKFKELEKILINLKNFLTNNEIYVNNERIQQAIDLCEECKKRSNFIKKIQMSYNNTKITISVYKNNKEYVCFKFSNRGIKYCNGIIINDLEYHQDFKKLSNFSDILDILEESNMLVNWVYILGNN